MKCEPYIIGLITHRELIFLRRRSASERTGLVRVRWWCVEYFKTSSQFEGGKARQQNGCFCQQNGLGL